MKFKIDENLPVEISGLLRSQEHDSTSVFEEQLHGSPDSILTGVCIRENRILITLDLDFADILSYPPEKMPGIVVLRIIRQDKNHILETVQRIIDLLNKETLEHRLWIVEESRIRIHGE